MKSVKLIVAYPQPTDASAFEKVYAEEHVPMAIANLHGKTKIVATRVLPSPEGDDNRTTEITFQDWKTVLEIARENAVI